MRSLSVRPFSLAVRSVLDQLIVVGTLAGWTFRGHVIVTDSAPSFQAGVSSAFSKSQLFWWWLRVSAFSRLRDRLVGQLDPPLGWSNCKTDQIQNNSSLADSDHLTRSKSGSHWVTVRSGGGSMSWATQMARTNHSWSSWLSQSPLIRFGIWLSKFFSVTAAF